MTEPIYKICSLSEWNAALAAGKYSGSADDARDGFIHFSCSHQLATTAAKYFAGRTDLVIVAVDQERLGAALRLEASRGDDLFPHVYGALSVEAVLWTAPLPWDGSKHVLPVQSVVTSR